MEKIEKSGKPSIFPNIVENARRIFCCYQNNQIVPGIVQVFKRPPKEVPPSEFFDKISLRIPTDLGIHFLEISANKDSQTLEINNSEPILYERFSYGSYWSSGSKCHTIFGKPPFLAFSEDLEYLIQNQKTSIIQILKIDWKASGTKETPLKYEFSEWNKSINRFFDEFERILKSRDPQKLLKVRELQICTSDEEQVLKILKFVDPNFLKALKILNPWNLELQKSIKIEEIPKTEQWKNLEDVDIRLSIDCKNLDPFLLFLNVTIVMEKWDFEGCEQFLEKFPQPGKPKNLQFLIRNEKSRNLMIGQLKNHPEYEQAETFEFPDPEKRYFLVLDNFVTLKK
ncbi:hypothetical protein L3Y34_009811 [Caenorhabditis briggsae]|nr:hypothetical protein L3Y34_009811 [Caenorhabditis briggsae]